MKYFIFSIALLLAGSSTINAKAMSISEDGQEIILVKNNDEPIRDIIKDRDPESEGGDVARGIVVAPLQASLYNNMVCLNFIETFSSVTVTITNLSTGEVVYHEESSHPTALTIELLATESASYMLEVQTGSTVWEGFFSN